jgi:peptide/nickel transport system substrate-binding protein
LFESRRLRAGIVGAATLAVFAVAWAGSAGAAAAKPTLTIAASTLYCSNLSPAIGYETQWGLAYETLLTWNGYGKPYTSGVLSSWKLSDGNKVMTMTIKPNIHFSDGSLLDAAAVQTYLAWRPLQANAVKGNAFLGPIAHVDVVSKYVVRVTLKTPNPDFEFAMSQKAFNWGTIASPTAIAAVTADPKSPIFTQGTYGFGPYMLDPSQTVLGNHCTYVPNPYYYDKSKIKWGEVVVEPLADPTAQLAAVQTGQVDVLVASPTVVGPAKAAGYKVFSNPSTIASILLRDHGGLNPALASVKVRQALNYALDRKAIAQSVYAGIATPTSSPDAGGDGDDPKFVNYYSYNPAKAKALLAAAGYPNGFTIKALTVQGGLGLSVDQDTEVACQYWSNIGVKCDLTVAPNLSAFVTDLYSTKNFSVAGFQDSAYPVWAWFSLYANPQNTHSDQWGWFDAVNEKVFLKAQRESAAASQAAWKQIMDRAIEQAEYIPVVIQPVNSVVGKRVGGFSLTGSGLLTTWFPTGK